MGLEGCAPPFECVAWLVDETGCAVICAAVGAMDTPLPRPQVGSRKWEVGSGKWEVGGGRWEVGSGEWEG